MSASMTNAAGTKLRPLLLTDEQIELISFALTQTQLYEADCAREGKEAIDRNPARAVGLGAAITELHRDRADRLAALRILISPAGRL